MGASRHKGMVRRGERVERSSGAAPPLRSGRSGEPSLNGKRLMVEVEAAAERVNACVVTVAGELDLSTIPLLEKDLLREAGSDGDVIVDLTGVSFIDSSGIALLIEAFRAGGDSTRLFTVVAAESQVDRVFQLAGIDRVLPVFTDRGSAIEALNEASGG
jgi:anti-sigma B factor antagonist